LLLRLRLEVYLQHFSEKDSVLVLNFTHAFHLLELFLVVVDHVGRLRWLLDVHYGLHTAQPLHVEDVVLHLFALGN